MFKFVIFFIAAGLIAVLLIRYLESQSIFFPMKEKPLVAENAPAHEEVFFASKDGVKLHGRFIPAGAEAPVVLFLHGNAGNIGHRWEKIQILHDLGVSVFIFDYRGYGLSEGRASETGIYQDVEAAYGELEKRGVPPEKIVLYGESLGGAFAVDLAAKKPVKALIVEGTFTSIPAMARKVVPFLPSFVMATKLDSLSKIGKVSASKLILHSVDDEIIPFAMGEALFQAAPEPKRLVRLRGGHNTSFIDDLQTYHNALKEFLK